MREGITHAKQSMVVDRYKYIQLITEHAQLLGFIHGVNEAMKIQTGKEIMSEGIRKIYDRHNNSEYTNQEGSLFL